MKSMSTTVHVKRLPRRANAKGDLKQALWAMAAAYGEVRDVMIFHGKCKANIEFVQPEGAAAMLSRHHASPITWRWKDQVSE